MSQIVQLPQNVRAANEMRRAINERASRICAREPNRIHAVCEGVRLMSHGSSSGAAVQLGWQQLIVHGAMFGAGGGCAA